MIALTCWVIAALSGAELQLSVEGKAVGDAGCVIVPGQPNRLLVRALEAEIGSAGIGLKLARIQPDGRRGEQSARLTRQSPQAVLDLGLFAVPCQFDYEAGTLWRRACRFELTVTGPTQAGSRQAFFLTVGPGDREVLALGQESRAAHLGWSESKRSRPLDPPIELWLAPEVLSNENDLGVMYRRRVAWEKGPPATAIRGRLRVTAEAGGRPLVEREVQVGPAAAAERIDASAWKPGRYRIEILPFVQGTADHDGPAVVYRRTPAESQAVRLSPSAPWQLRRDPSRGDVRIRAFEGDALARLALTGDYAVFATAAQSSCYLQVGRAGLVRGIRGERVFIEAANLTGQTIRLHSPPASLGELWLAPVTADSADSLRAACRRPPVPLRGVADWADYFAPPAIHHSAGARVALDQFDALLGGHAELGLSSIAWSVGRSWVEYHSRLAQTTRFPCKPLETIDPQFRDAYAGRTAMIAMTDPLDYVLSHRSAHGLTILPWLAMQRHYGARAYGGIFASKWFVEHPQWHEWAKNAARPTGSTVCYFFPEVRKERVDILCEVAERQPDGLVIDCCRQVPLLLYHPEMAAAYQQRTGVDPRTIDAADGPKYVDWIRWRADWFTQVLRDLKGRLGPIRARSGRAIPVVVRIPTKGLFYNLAQGIDLERWCREGLLDQIQLDPLEDCGGRGENHSVQPYVELAHRYRLRVFGGVNGNTFWNYPAVLRRAMGLCRAGVDGLELYESNNFAVSSERRWLVPLLGNAALAERFLEESNLEACYPTWSRTAAAGFDNHSFHGQWSVFGKGGTSL
jgi:hypothetical protein